MKIFVGIVLLAVVLAVLLWPPSKEESKEHVLKPDEKVPEKQAVQLLTTQDAILFIEKKQNVYDVEKYLRSKGIPYTATVSDEGRLHWGRYEIKRGTPVQDVIKRMKAKFSKYNGKVSYDTLILASLVEKEMWDKTEARRLAGVFKNRLEKGMRLQSDPTTVYGHYRKYLKRNPPRILRKDWDVKSAWNTYKIKGLPATPICTPTKTAINAVKNPEKHEYLFFMGKGGRKHHFSKTYQEHLDFGKKLRADRDKKKSKKKGKK